MQLKFLLHIKFTVKIVKNTINSIALIVKKIYTYIFVMGVKMHKKKKSNILYKSAGFIALIAVIVVIIIISSNIKVEKNHNEFVKKVKIEPDKLGYETFENIKNNNNTIACNDAKQLGTLFVKINRNLSEDDNITAENIQQYAVSTPDMQLVDKFSNDLVDVVREKYSDNHDAASLVLRKISQDIYTNIVQISLMIETGNISEKEFYDFLDINYCGVIPPESYISPKDIVIYSINNSLGSGILDNYTDSTVTDNVSLGGAADNVSQ